MYKQKFIKIIKLIMLLIFLVCAFSLTAQVSPVPGDVNNDKQVNILDALMLAQYYVGITPSGFQATAGDVDGNGTINIVDALLVAQYYVGLISTFPVQTLNSVEVVKSEIDRNMAPALETGELAAIADGNNLFGFDCFQVLKNEPLNFFFSPISVSYAFAMCYAGANGNTETEIARTLHFTLPETQFHNAYNALDLALTNVPTTFNPATGEELKLHIANSIWGQRDYFFYPQYLDTLAYNYGAALNTVDFTANPEKCRLLINDWVSNQTEKRIPDLLPSGSITPLTRLVLANAIYFKAVWYYPFKEESTTQDPFYLLNGTTQSTPMMHQTFDTNYYEVSGQYQAVKIAYQGSRKNSMFIILPEEGNWSSIENNFTYNTFKEINQGMSGRRVIMSLPKFSYKWGSSIKSLLATLGISEAFNSSLADFSGITNKEKIYISDVIHKAFISVDEKGTEAAAATAILLPGSSQNPPTPPPTVTMTINRPFLFLIYNENTGTILFMGRVVQPE